jgi:hypothetical protein
MWELPSITKECPHRSNYVLVSLDVDGCPIHSLPKYHLGIHHSCKGEGVFIALNGIGVVDVLVHFYTSFLENITIAMMQIGLVGNAMLPVARMWKNP